MADLTLADILAEGDEDALDGLSSNLDDYNPSLDDILNESDDLPPSVQAVAATSPGAKLSGAAKKSAAKAAPKKGILKKTPSSGAKKAGKRVTLAGVAAGTAKVPPQPSQHTNAVPVSPPKAVSPPPAQPPLSSSPVQPSSLDDSVAGLEVLRPTVSALTASSNSLQTQPSNKFDDIDALLESVGASSAAAAPPPAAAPASKDVPNIPEGADEELRKILTERDDTVVEEGQGSSLDSMIRSFILDKPAPVDDVSILTQIKDEERRLLNVDESKRLLANLEERRKQTELNTSTMSSSKLDKVSQLVSSKKKKIGIPSSVAVSSKYIAIGTSHGLVAVFDHFQEIKIVLGTQECVEYGPIYSVDISFDSEWLACGHQGGQILVWDIVTGNQIRSFLNDHKEPVIYTRFIDNKRNRLFACSLDGVAKLYRLSYVLMIWVTDTEVILNGNAGRILCIANLTPGSTPHPIDNYSLAAFCTEKKVAVIAIQQTVKVFHQIARPPNIRPGCLPYLAWREVIAREGKDGKKKMLDPILAIAWGKQVKLIQVVLGRVKARPNQLDFITIAEYETDCEITGFQWVGPAVLVLLNAKDELRVLDPFALEEIEIKSAKSMELVYHSKFVNPQGKAEFSFHNSVRCYKSRLYLLGVKAIYTAHILTWEERIAALVNAGKWVEALGLALDFYQGRARAVEGLARDMRQAKLELSLKIEQLLRDYVQVNLGIQNPKDPKHYDSIATIAIDYCLCINREDILFDQLLPIFRAAQKHGLLLQKLEPFIVGDKITKLPPEVIQSLVQYYSTHNMLRRIEQIILHLDIAHLDFHAIVKLCSRHYLSSALFYLFIQALNDYVTPMEYLMKVLVKDSHLFGTPEQQQLRKTIGYKILVYLSYVFAGKAFPTGAKINPIRYEEVKEEIFTYLLKERVEEAKSERYPRLCALLHLDSSEFFRVVSIACDATSSSVRLKVLLDILIKLMIDTSISTDGFYWTERTKNWPFNAAQIGHLFEFIAKYFARGTVDVSDYILRRLLAYLLLNTDGTSSKNRERIALDILHSNCPPQRLFYDKLLDVAETGKYYKVAEFFHMQKRDYARVIRCHLQDDDLQKAVFEFIARLMKNNKLTKPEKDAVRNTTLASLSALVKLDSDKTTILVADVFTDDSDRVVGELDKFPELQFAYLKSLLQHQSKQGKDQVQLSVTAGERLLELMCQFDKEQVRDWLVEWESLYRLDTAIRFCEQYDLTSAYCMLLERAGDFTKALSIYMQNIQKKCASMIAFCKTIDIPVYQGPRSVEEDAKVELPIKGQEEEVKKALLATIHMIKRNAQRLEAQEIKALWFQLLDTTMKPLGELEAVQKTLGPSPPENGAQADASAAAAAKSSTPTNVRRRGQATSSTKITASTSNPFLEMNDRQLFVLRQTFAQMISYVLENMIGFVSMQVILEKLVKDRGDSHFGDFRSIFTMMLDNYAYEHAILSTAGNLLRYDTWQAFAQMVKARKGPYSTLKYQEATDGVPEPSSVEKLYKFRVDNYTPPKDVSRFQLLQRLERGDTNFVTSSTALAPREASRRELYHSNALQIGNRVPGILDQNSRFFNVIGDEEKDRLQRLTSVPPKR